MKIGKLAAKPGGLSLTLELIQWKERADPTSCPLIPRHIHTYIHTHKQPIHFLNEKKKI